ncbi:MAG: hypothetical protein KKA73_20290, partial [Chloroflexi bacterium]|nr:hypothetical protein [Chloroflexota bacterium]
MSESPKAEPPRSYDHIQRHWIALVLRVALPAGGTILLWVGTLVAFVTGSGMPWGVPVGLALLAVSLFTVGLSFVIYYDWQNDYLAINRESIIHYEQQYVFSHSSQAAPLPKVQNVGINIPNSLYRWLNVGRIFVDTAGQEGMIAFGPVKDPRGVQSHIFALLGRPVPIDLEAEPSTRFQKWLPINPVKTARGGLVWHRHWWVLLRRLFWSTVLNLGLLVVFVL